MPSLAIGNKNDASWSLRPRRVLRRADIAFEAARIPLRRPGPAAELAAWSSSGKVPALCAK